MDSWHLMDCQFDAKLKAKILKVDELAAAAEAREREASKCKVTRLSQHQFIATDKLDQTR